MKIIACVAVVMFSILSASVVWAQTVAPAQNFVFLRGGSASPVLANYNLTIGKKIVWVGTLQAVHAEPAYREIQVGLGQAFGTSQVFVLALHASDGWYLQLVGLPSVTKGKLTLSAFVVGYVPLAEGGAKQLLLDPATALVKVGSRVSLGGSYTFYKSQGLEFKHAIGPTLQLALPKGSLNFDFFKGLRNYRSEARITLQLTF